MAYTQVNINLHIVFTLSPDLQDVLHAFHCHLQYFGILHLWLQLQQMKKNVIWTTRTDNTV